MTFALAFAACSSSSSSPQSTTDASMQTSGYGTSACGTCVAQACSSQQSACSQDPQCATYLSCLQQCPLDSSGNADASCAAACPLPNDAPGQSAQAAFDTCRTQGDGASCSACGAAPQDGGAEAAPDGANLCALGNQPPCTQCKLTNCCSALTACAEDSDCGQITLCATNCTDGPDGGGLLACKYQCIEQHPAGAALYGTQLSCGQLECAGPSACASTCDACNAMSCKSEYQACMQDGNCVQLFYCTGACSDTSCAGMCTSKFGNTAANEYNSWANCFVNKCANSCG